ncbi:bifunctional diguanylate cyclase/phosphodiesterase [Actinoplanes sp. NPDC048796]|uniref:putative bifunctional diguanylate cyclase/phosphodiesterase n=1 Tax=Actinoplanes sp. NPDC048796 TaxID=3155640 RepID=UPI0033FB9A26
MGTDLRTPVRYVVAAVTVTLLGAVWFLTRPGPDAIAYLFMPAGGAAGILAILSLMRGRSLDPVTRRFWWHILTGMSVLSAGYLILAVVAFRTAPTLPAIPLPAAALAGIGMLTAMWGVMRVPLGAGGPGARRRQLIDRTIAFVGVGTLLWTFGLAPMITGSDGWSAQSTALIGISFLLGLGGITKVSYIDGGPVDRSAIRLIAATALTGVGVALLSTGGDRNVLLAQAIVMPLTHAFVATAAYRQSIATGAPARRSGTLLPYLALAAADASLLSLLWHGHGWTANVVVVATVPLTGLVAVRQMMALRENGRLLRAQRVSEDRLRHEATHDGLTGLGNRGLFRTRVAEALQQRDTTVLLVDLDDFKTVNDSLGHDVGDQLLIAVAGALSAAVGPDGLPVRLAGDEFAVLLVPGADGETVARRVLDEFAQPLSDHRLLVHASIGIATAGAGAGLDPLLRHADVAMYAAKQRGKGNAVRYHDGMEQPVLAHARIGGELRRALDAGEFRVHYQPLMELATGRVVGVEPLVRWQHPTRGLVPPGEFIPAAEGTGLIVPLGRFVLRESCRQAAAWLAEFGPDCMRKLGPNVSVRQLHDPDFVADVRAALADSGLPADRLVLELTESAVLRGPQVSRTLRELHEMGVRLALDDFGTGESSLSLLRSFPASIVKLDKSFVDGIELDEMGTPEAEARQAVARAVVQLAGALGLDTVAEGIENQEQADRLQRLGYTLGQGYHLARPMPAEEMTRLLSGRVELAKAA